MTTVAFGSWATMVPASKRGISTVPVPLARAQCEATNRPWAWKSGRAWSTTSSGPKPQTCRRVAALEARLRWLSMAPLGRPVVPLV